MTIRIVSGVFRTAANIGIKRSFFLGIAFLQSGMYTVHRVHGLCHFRLIYNLVLTDSCTLVCVLLGPSKSHTEES